MLGEGLRLIRVFHDCKTSELAKSLDISAGYISEIESGKKTPSIDILNKYATHFDIPLSAILFFSEELDKNKTLKSSIRSKLIKFLQIIEDATK